MEPFPYAKPFIPILVFVVAAGLLQCTRPQENGQNRPSGNPVQSQQQAPATPELAEYMSSLQLFTHKTALAVEAENGELAQFYFHEMRATMNSIKRDVPGYEGYNIAQFMEIFLDPTIQPFDRSLRDRNWEEARNHFDEIINSCNTCHRATSHGFIQVTAGYDKNPYNQVFKQQP